MITREILNHGGEVYIIKYRRQLEGPSQEQLDALKAFYGADTVMTANQTGYLFLEKIPDAEVVEA